ncbi:hypothetical protein RSAG8_09680, partial [Rhizoctonia solani AG-8 WAC10335]
MTCNWSFLVVLPTKTKNKTRAFIARELNVVLHLTATEAAAVVREVRHGVAVHEPSGAKFEQHWVPNRNRGSGDARSAVQRTGVWATRSAR